MKSLRTLIEKNKKVFIGLAAVAVLYSIWNTFLRESGQSAFTSEASVDASSSDQGRRIVATLARLNTVSIDASILSTNLFANLQDFSRPLPQDVPAGKVNPFVFEGVSSNPLTTSDLNPTTPAPSVAPEAIVSPVVDDADEERAGSENDAPADPTNTQ